MKEETEKLAQRLHRAASPEARRRVFCQLFERYRGAALQQASALLGGDRHLAQDAVQEAFCTADAHLEQLRHPGAFGSWLQRIVATQCNRLRRQRKSGAHQPLESTCQLPAKDPDPAGSAEAADLAAKVRAKVDDLPDHQRRVAQLFYLEGCSQRQIARAVGIPVKTVKSRLYDSRRQLQKTLADGLELCPTQERLTLGGRPTPTLAAPLLWRRRRYLSRHLQPAGTEPSCAF